jgi:xanthine/uracil permease
MSLDTLGDLNWLAVIVAAIAYFALGALWYAPPVFGRARQRAGGVEIPEGQRPGPAFYLGPLLTCLLATVATGMLALATASTRFGEGASLGVVLGVGVAAAVVFVMGIFDTHKPDPMTWFAISAGYHLVGLTIAAVIVSVWE